MEDNRIQQLLTGVLLSDGLARVLSLRVVSHDIDSTSFDINNDNSNNNNNNNNNYFISFKPKSPRSTLLAVAIKEGRNRILRRLCYTVGFRLLALHRTRISNIELDGLEQGEYRHLRRDEIEELWESAGGRDSPSIHRIQALMRIAERQRQTTSNTTHTTPTNNDNDSNSNSNGNMINNRYDVSGRVEPWFHENQLSCLLLEKDNNNNNNNHSSSSTCSSNQPKSTTTDNNKQQ